MVILPGEGFWASAVRSVVTASFLVKDLLIDWVKKKKVLE